MTASADAQALLDAIVDALGDTAPARAMVVHGTPVHELMMCDQLTITCLSVTHPQQDRQGRGRMSTATWEWQVEIVRCVPGQGETPQAPDAEVLDASAKRLLDDLETIDLTIRNSAGAIFAACRGITYGDAFPVEPSGQRGGWRWPLTVTT